MSGNPVKVAQLHARQKFTPFGGREFTNRAFGVGCAAYQDRFAVARYSDAGAALAGARNAPVESVRTRRMHLICSSCLINQDYYHFALTVLNCQVTEALHAIHRYSKMLLQ